MIANSGRDLASIQYLRGIAALMIVLVHADYQVSLMGASFGFDVLAAGVDIFFVISGFIMCVSTSRAPERTAGEFLRDRIVRIAPLYWGITLFIAAIAVVLPTAMQSTQFDAKLLFASLFFIAWPNPSTGGFEPLLVAGWTLNLEMFFYVLFAVAIRVTDRENGRVLLLLGIIGTAALLVALLPGLPKAVQFYGNDVILDFAFGLMLGWLWLHRRPKQSPLWWFVCLGGFVCFFIKPLQASLPHFLAIGIPSAMVVAGAVFAPTVRFRALHMLGDSSYSLYLTHHIVLSVLAQVMKRAGLSQMPPVLFVLLAIAVSVIAGWIAFRLFERPLTEVAKRILERGKAIRTPPLAVTPSPADQTV